MSKFWKKLVVLLSVFVFVEALAIYHLRLTMDEMRAFILGEMRRQNVVLETLNDHQVRLSDTLEKMSDPNKERRDEK
jgi:hypothetical protein